MSNIAEGFRAMPTKKIFFAMAFLLCLGCSHTQQSFSNSQSAVEADSFDVTTSVLTELMRYWRAMSVVGAPADVRTLIDSNGWPKKFSSLLPIDDSPQIRSAEKGLIRAKILREVRDLNVFNASASAKIRTDEANPPYGLVAGRFEEIYLTNKATGEWVVSGRKGIAILDYTLEPAKPRPYDFKMPGLLR